MNTFKKIYMALMAMTVISLVVAGLYLLGIVELTGDTGAVVKQIVFTIVPLTLLFSKAANVIANRTNVNLGYGITFALLIYLLLFVLQITVKPDIPLLVYLILFVVLGYLILLTLIYEVPQANTAHKKFQKILTIIGTLTFILSIIFFHTLDLGLLSILQNEQIKEAVRELAEPIQIAFTALAGTTIIGIIINPMMRVYHIDNDFVAVGELDDALSRTGRYQTNTNPNPTAILSDKYKKDIKKENKVLNFANSEQIIQELPEQVVSELPKEKVVNQKYQEASISNTEIPAIINVETPPELVINTETKATEGNTNEVVQTAQPEVKVEATTEAPATPTQPDQNLVEKAKAAANEVVQTAQPEVKVGATTTTTQTTTQ